MQAHANAPNHACMHAYHARLCELKLEGVLHVYEEKISSVDALHQREEGAG